jgi:3-(3-hydroxy-phenyl)propionate hydroxylase
LASIAVAGVADPACPAKASAATKATLQQLDAVLIAEGSGGVAGWVANPGVAAALMRPDRYIFGTVGSGADLDAPVSRLDSALTERGGDALRREQTAIDALVTL